jgi:hypothetical protein
MDRNPIHDGHFGVVIDHLTEDHRVEPPDFAPDAAPARFGTTVALKID